MAMSASSMLLAAAGVTAAASNCSVDVFQTFLNSNGTNAQVVYAEYYPENSTFVNPNTTFGASPSKLPATCAVQINATTDVGTHFSFGAFLPDKWNDRFL